MQIKERRKNKPSDAKPAEHKYFHKNQVFLIHHAVLPGIVLLHVLA